MALADAVDVYGDRSGYVVDEEGTARLDAPSVVERRGRTIGFVHSLLGATLSRRARTTASGCRHAGMDVYKWRFTLAPAVPSDLTIAAFELTRKIRELDMAASPYDLSDFGVEPDAIETPAGKAEYVEHQRGFTVRSNALRRRLLDVLDPLHPNLPGQIRV